MEQVSATWVTEWPSFGVAFFTSVVLAATALYVYFQLKHAQTERELRFVLDLARIWNSDSMEEARQAANTYRNGCELSAAMAHLEAINSRHYYVLLRIPAFFDDIGVACKMDKHLLCIVRDSLKLSVIHYHNLFLPWITDLGSTPSGQNVFQPFKNLREWVESN